MKNQEVKRIGNMLKNVYAGAAWHGPSIMEVLNSISPEQAFMPTKKIHKICELVQHMTAWRIFAIKKLQQDHHYEVSQNENWKEFTNKDEKAWDEIKNDLELSQQQLIDEIEKIEDDILEEEVDKKAYSYYTLLHGVIQHDLYHLGEIMLLSKLN
jgi:hypothetical protein